MHTTNRYSVGICIHAAATAAATTTKTAMALRILGSSVRNWWQGLGRNQSSATASSWVHENEQAAYGRHVRSEEHTSELQSLRHLVCRLLLEKKKECRSSYNIHE